MPAFTEDALLTTATGKRLFTAYAKDLPIIDYHCHLPPDEIRRNAPFTDVGEMWLAYDHYKWRAMRSFGIDERLITGDASYRDKFMAFAAIMPELAGHPLFIWCALELKRYFDIDAPLSSRTAEAIYRQCGERIAAVGMSPRWCMERAKVEALCTTDDPADSLEHHIAMTEAGGATRVLPGFRPDTALYCDRPAFAAYTARLADAAALSTDTFAGLIAALTARLDFFVQHGAVLADTGVDQLDWREGTEAEVEAAYQKARRGGALTREETHLYRSAFLAALGRAYAERGLVMQLHVGIYQSANQRAAREIGVAGGFDCTGDPTGIRGIGGLLNRLYEDHALPKTILYPLNPAQTETFGVLAAGFCHGAARGPVQLGAPWWFNDHPYGIRRQFEAAGVYPLSVSVGMLTDSRSYLSYPRHELYRRLLCDYLGTLIERGEYYAEEKDIETLVGNVCYHNAKTYFGL